MVVYRKKLPNTTRVHHWGLKRAVGSHEVVDVASGVGFEGTSICAGTLCAFGMVFARSKWIGLAEEDTTWVDVEEVVKQS